jgi:hypothetical protein
MPDVKQKVALSSIGASAGLTAAKAVVGVMSGSLALLSERPVPSRGSSECRARPEGGLALDGAGGAKRTKSAGRPRHPLPRR